MQKCELGQSGIEVSSIGLGCNNFGYFSAPAAATVIHKALDLGVTFFDTADVYGTGVSEMNLGRALGPRRRDVVIATKFGMPMGEGKAGGSAAYVKEACEASLGRLGTDWIDLYQIHRPDPATPIEETMRALSELVSAGKVRAVGCSNLSPRQVIEANEALRSNGNCGLVSAQDEYSLLERGIERDLIPVLNEHRMSLLPYFPLASGMLTGKYQRGVVSTGTRLSAMKHLADKYMTDTNWSIVDDLTEFCAARGRTLLELAFAWLRARSFLASIIAGATRTEQLAANVAAADWVLTADELAAVDTMTAKHESFAVRA